MPPTLPNALAIAPSSFHMDLFWVHPDGLINPI